MMKKKPRETRHEKMARAIATGKRFTKKMVSELTRDELRIMAIAVEDAAKEAFDTFSNSRDTSKTHPAHKRLECIGAVIYNINKHARTSPRYIWNESGTFSTIWGMRSIR